MPTPKAPHDVVPNWHFTVARRGYDRSQVDDYLRTMAAHLDELRVVAQREQRRAERAERALEEARTAQPPTAEPDEDTGFGQRVERLLRAAETEAKEVRSSAAREAENVLAHAQSQAEQLLREHYDQVERERMTAAATLSERHGTAERELARLHTLHDGVRTQLADLLDSLTREFGGPRAVLLGMAAPNEEPTRALTLGAGRPQPSHPAEPLGRAG
jgi:DivIVA domain-containing protein